jgi:hypothetical protein
VPNRLFELVAFSDSQEDTCLLYKQHWYIRQYLIVYPKKSGDLRCSIDMGVAELPFWDAVSRALDFVPMLEHKKRNLMLRLLLMDLRKLWSLPLAERKPFNPFR